MKQGIIIKQIDEIKSDPNQPRKEWNDEELKRFGNSFKETGQINPIEIDENNMIVTGESRWRACKLSGVKTIRCIRIEGLTPEERLTRQLAENIARKNLTINEQKDGIKRKIEYMSKRSSSFAKDKFHQGDYFKGYESIGREIGCSGNWIKDVLDLDKAPKIIQKAVKEKKMSVKVATAIRKLPDEKQQEEYAKDYLAIKKTGFKKDSNRVAEDISEINNGHKKPKFEETSIHVGENILEDLGNLQTDINKMRDLNIEDLSQSKKDKIATSICITFGKTIKPFLIDLVKNGAVVDKRFMELIKIYGKE